MNYNVMEKNDSSRVVRFKHISGALLLQAEGKCPVGSYEVFC